MCHLARDQCFKSEFPEETEHDLEGESLWKLFDSVFIYCPIWSFDPWGEFS